MVTKEELKRKVKTLQEENAELKLLVVKKPARKPRKKKPEPKIGYKVVGTQRITYITRFEEPHNMRPRYHWTERKVNNPPLLLSFSYYSGDDRCVYYGKEPYLRWVEPRKGMGPLSLFDTLEHAKAWASKMDNSWREKEDSWKLYEAEYIEFDGTDLGYSTKRPEGTVLAKKVRLKKMLETGN
jgi:hypothetical protein